MLLKVNFSGFAYAGYLKGAAGLMCIISAELCVALHDPNRILTGWNRQYWRACRPDMHLHENHSIKRAGVAGIRVCVLPYVCLFIKIKVLFSVGTLVPAGRLARLKFIVQFRVAKDTDFSFASPAGAR